MAILERVMVSDFCNEARSFGNFAKKIVLDNTTLTKAESYLLSEYTKTYILGLIAQSHKLDENSHRFKILKHIPLVSSLDIAANVSMTKAVKGIEELDNLSHLFKLRDGKLKDVKSLAHLLCSVIIRDGNKVKNEEALNIIKQKCTKIVEIWVGKQDTVSNTY